MSMSRKDYRAVAAAFRPVVEAADAEQLRQLSALAKALSDIFFEDNRRFSSSRFPEAAGFDARGDAMRAGRS